MREVNTEVGSGISTVKLKKDNSVNDHLARYVFSPMLAIDLSDRNITGAMSQITVRQGRITNFTDCPYKIRDESSDALLSATNDDEFYNAPLTEHIHNAKNQADYLDYAYSLKGLVVLDELTGETADNVVAIEEAILPEHIDTILELGKYLSDGEAINENIAKAGLSNELQRKARKMIPALQEGIRQATKFATDWLMETKAEIINSRNGKAGKSSVDPFDMEMYRQTGIAPLVERDVNYAATAQKAEDTGNKELANAILALANSNNKESEAEAKLKAVEAQMEEMRKMVAGLTLVKDETTDPKKTNK